MNAWLSLTIAIIAEVIATSALKASEGFSRPWPSVLVVVGYAAAFYFLSLTLRRIPIGIAYAVWAGAGTVLITVIGAVVFRQKIDLAGGIGIGLIVAGVLVLNLQTELGALMRQSSCCNCSKIYENILAKSISISTLSRFPSM